MITAVIACMLMLKKSKPRNNTKRDKLLPKKSYLFKEYLSKVLLKVKMIRTMPHLNITRLKEFLVSTNFKKPYSLSRSFKINGKE